MGSIPHVWPVKGFPVPRRFAALLLIFAGLLAGGCAHKPSVRERDLAMADQDPEIRGVLGDFSTAAVKDLGYAVTRRRYFPWPSVKHAGPHRYRIEGAAATGDYAVVEQPDGPCYQLTWGTAEATALMEPVLRDGAWEGLAGNCKPVGTFHSSRSTFYKSDCDGFDWRGRYAQSTVLLREGKRLTSYTIMAEVHPRTAPTLLGCFSDADLVAGRDAVVAAAEAWFESPARALIYEDPLLQTELVGRTVADGRTTVRAILKVHDGERIDSYRLVLAGTPTGWRVREAKPFVDPADSELP